MLKNGGLHLLIRGQKFDFRNLFYIQVFVVAPIVCVVWSWRLGECSVVLGALSSLAIVLLRTIELIALL